MSVMSEEKKAIESIYKVEQKGDDAGLRGWWTILRNGNPIEHHSTEDECYRELRKIGVDGLAHGGN